MRFINLTNLQIEEIQEYQTITLSLQLKQYKLEDLNLQILKQEILKTISQYTLNRSTQPTHVHFDVQLNLDAYADNFLPLSIINTISTLFTSYIVTDKIISTREYRYNVPENLQQHVHFSFSTLKKLINYECLLSVFNLTIKINDIYFDATKED